MRSSRFVVLRETAMFPGAVDSGGNYRNCWVVEDIEEFVPALHFVVDRWLEVFHAHLAEVA